MNMQMEKSTIIITIGLSEYLNLIINQKSKQTKHYYYISFSTFQVLISILKFLYTVKYYKNNNHNRLNTYKYLIYSIHCTPTTNNIFMAFKYILCDSFDFDVFTMTLKLHISQNVLEWTFWYHYFFKNFIFI